MNKTKTILGWVTFAAVLLGCGTALYYGLGTLGLGPAARVQETNEQLWKQLVNSDGELLDEASALRLMRAGVDPNEPMAFVPPMTFLHLTESASNAKEAIGLGADPDVRAGSNGPTPLFATRSPEVAKVLLDAGADPDVTSGGRKAIHDNISNAVVQVMLENGIDADTRTQGGSTPLAMLFLPRRPTSGVELIAWDSISWRQQRMSILLKYGADVNAEDENGVSVLDLAFATKKLYVGQGSVRPPYGLLIPPNAWPEQYAMLRELIEASGSERLNLDREVALAFIDCHEMPTPPTEAYKKLAAGEPLTPEETEAINNHRELTMPTSAKRKLLAPIVTFRRAPRYEGSAEDADWVVSRLREYVGAGITTQQP